MNQPESTIERQPVPVMGDAAETRARRLRSERAELIGWLAGAVAHDVNNVLAVIAGYADLIESDLEPGDAHAADAAGIRDAVFRAGDLVRQLITVGRRQTLRLEVLDATHLVRGLLPLLTSACGERISVELHASSEPAAVLADRSLLEQALLNLAVNARDAMPGGGTLAVRISTGPRPASVPGRPTTRVSDGLTLPAHGPTPPGSEREAAGVSDRDGARAGLGAETAETRDEVRISIEDTGAGIDPAILPHIFEPFFTTKGRGQGTGIGLASVEEAAAQCGGTVTVESRLGEGARFRLHLPRVAGEATAHQRPRASEPTRGGTETILVVDPDPEVRLVLARLLRRLGYTVADAATARHAMALVEHALDRVDALITEASLPDITGSELSTLVRVVHPGIPVLLLSRAARTPQRASPGQPAHRVLGKPFTAEQLGETLRALLDAGVVGA